MNNENHDAISGNAVKMRAALKQIHDCVNSLNEDCGVDPIDVRDLARAALEADEEKPEPCPFCGKEVVVGFSENIHKEKYRQVWCSDGERCGYECVMKKTEEEAIAAHNRVCRAVETAAKQSVTDCNHLGNAEKMRKALKQIHDRVNSLNEDCGVDPIDVRDLARAALSASPRNCDVGTAEEQDARHAKWCDRKHNKDCAALACILCFSKWAQMPYEEGDAK